MINNTNNFASAKPPILNSAPQYQGGNSVISNNIRKNMEAQKLDLFKMDKFSKKRKNDNIPNVGIIDTPPQNKTPIASELNKEYNTQTPKEKKHKKPHTQKNVAGFGILMTCLAGLFLVFNEAFELIKKHH